MKKLSRIELRDVKGGVTTPPGGGSGGTGGGTGGGGSTPVICNFTSTTCGNMCLDISTPSDTFPTVSTCQAYLAYLNPSCHFVAHTVTSCGAA